MESIKTLISKIMNINFGVGTEHWVDVTHINNPHSFYVRLVECRQYMDIIEKHDPTLAYSHSRTESDIIFKSDKTNSYIRGKILSLDEKNTTQLKILASDYGFIENSVNILNVHLPLHKINLPQLAHHCQLADCKPLQDTWDAEASEGMLLYTKNERARMIVRNVTPGMLTVELINTNNCISTLLAMAEYTRFGWHENQLVNRLTVLKIIDNNFKFKDLNIKDKLIVRALTGKSLKEFYVAEINDYKKYLQVKSDFNYHTKTFGKNIKQLEKNKPIALYNLTTNTYERGCIKELISEDKAIVFLIDSGTEVTAAIGLMKNLHERYLTDPAIAICCKVTESQIWDNNLKKVLHPGSQFMIEVIEMDKSNPIQSLYTVNIFTIN